MRKYRGQELPALKIKADALVKRAHELEFESAGLITENYQAHRRGDRLDLAELGVELPLVLCSIAVLTKLPSFWYGRIVAGIAGAIIAISAFVFARGIPRARLATARPRLSVRRLSHLE